MCWQLLLQTNLPVPPGAEIRIKNLKGVTSPLDVHVEVAGGMTITATWNVVSQYLIIRVPVNLSFVEPARMRFVLQNPAREQAAPSITVEITGWHATQTISSLATGSGMSFIVHAEMSSSSLRR